MTHELSLKGHTVVCTCGEISTEISDQKFFAPVAERHLMEHGIWPYEKPLGDKFNGWPNN